MNGDEVSAFVIGIFFGGLLAAILLMHVADRAWRKETVERGLALYCPDDGKWSWNGECEND